MITPRTLLFTALAPLALAARPQDHLTYSPKAGSTLTREFSSETELSLEDMSMEMDGNDVSQLAGNMDMAMKITHKLAVTDLYEAVADGRPSKLKRTFDEITTNTRLSTNSAQMGQTEQSVDMLSALEGSSVAFSLEDDGGYQAAFADGQEGDSDLLGGLLADMDLSAALPDREVAEGDTWELPLELMRQILQPAGDLSLRPEGDKQSEFDIGMPDLIDAMDGDFAAIYGGTREEDGVRVAVIKLRLEAHSAKDLGARSEEMIANMQKNLPPGVEVELSAFDVEFSYDAEGELYWDLAAGMPHALHLTGEVSQALDISMNIGNEQERRSIIQSMTFGGSMALSMTAGE
jgi:hypothetical protein